MLYFLVSSDGSEILEKREVEVPYEEGAYNDKVASLENGKMFFSPVSIIDPAYDLDTEVREGPVDAYDYATDTATRTYTIRLKNAVENTADDIAALRDAGKDIALVLTELVQWNLDNTSMVADDFTPSVKQAYLDLKVIADRVK